MIGKADTKSVHISQGFEGAGSRDANGFIEYLDIGKDEAEARLARLAPPPADPYDEQPKQSRAILREIKLLKNTLAVLRRSEAIDARR